MPQTKYYGCNSKWREGPGCLREAQCLAAKTASKLGGSVLFIQVHVFYKLVMDGSTSEKQCVPGLIQMMVVISVSPTVSAICTPSNAADFFFFFLISEGEDEVKKVQFFN